MIKKILFVSLLAASAGFTAYTITNWYNDTYRFNVFGCEYTPGEMKLTLVASAEASDGGFYITDMKGVRAFHKPSAYYNCMLIQKD